MRQRERLVGSASFGMPTLDIEAAAMRIHSASFMRDIKWEDLQESEREEMRDMAKAALLVGYH